MAEQLLQLRFYLRESSLEKLADFGGFAAAIKFSGIKAWVHLAALLSFGVIELFFEVA